MTGDNSDTARYQRGVQAYASQFHISQTRSPPGSPAGPLRKGNPVGRQRLDRRRVTCATELIVIAALIAQGTEAHWMPVGAGTAPPN